MRDRNVPQEKVQNSLCHEFMITYHTKKPVQQTESCGSLCNECHYGGVHFQCECHVAYHILVLTTKAWPRLNFFLGQ